MPNHRYPKQCYMMLKALDDSGRKCWASKVKTILIRYGYGNVRVSQEIGGVNLFIGHFRQRIIGCYAQNWQSDKNNSSRCHHYMYYKTMLNTERYLTLENIPYKHKIAFSKFRCSNH